LQDGNPVFDDMDEEDPDDDLDIKIVRKKTFFDN
jgi:hypothetical protein